MKAISGNSKTLIFVYECYIKPNLVQDWQLLCKHKAVLSLKRLSNSFSMSLCDIKHNLHCPENLHFKAQKG